MNVVAVTVIYTLCIQHVCTRCENILFVELKYGTTTWFSC